MMAVHFATLARYNRWANALLFAACEEAGEAVWRPKVGAFHGSVLGTLNHILVMDRLWLGRVAGRDCGFKGVDEVVHDDLAALTGAREEFDDAIVAAVDALAEDDFARVVEYGITCGGTAREPLWLLLAHLFNHQTHHRGQITDMLTRAGHEIPSLDLVAFWRAVGGECAAESMAELR
jgi:uncharacterized damage-inducible protein DinB